MGSGLGFLLIVNRSSGDDFLLVFEVFVENLTQIEDARLAVYDCKHDHGNRFLHLRMLIQSVQDDICVGIFFEFDDDAHTFPVGLVTNLGNAFETLFLDHVCHLFDQSRLVDLIWDFSDDDLLSAAARFFNLGYGAHDDLALSGTVSLFGSVLAHNDGAGRKIRSLDDVGQIVNRAVRFVDDFDGCVDGLHQVVRRDRGCHTDGDTVRAVDQEIWESGRQYHWFFFFPVEVRDEIDGLFLDIAQHLQRQRGHSRLGVTHRRSAVAVDRAEVAVTVHQCMTDIPRLRQSDHRIVNRVVTVRMVFTHDFTNDTGGFFVWFIRRHAQLAHAVKNSSVYRLQTVAHVRQGAADDNAHGVVDIRLLHFVMDLMLQHLLIF